MLRGRIVFSTWVRKPLLNSPLLPLATRQELRNPGAALVKFQLLGQSDSG
jgi:hypothetical protein